MSVKDILEAAKQQAGRRGKAHSPLYEWLWSNYGALVPEFTAPRTPNWRAVAEALAAKGILGGSPPRGLREPRPPTAEIVRKTWMKVVRDKERMAVNDACRLQRHGEPPASPQLKPALIPVTFHQDAGEEPDGFVLQLAGGLKDWTKNKGNDDD